MPVPEAIAGGLTFKQVSAGLHHSCGVTDQDRAYCWGNYADGALGIGPTDTHQYTPVAVVGGLSFDMVSAGWSYTCGVTTDGKAYCWGLNQGRLGDGTTDERWEPVPVTGELEFVKVSTGGRQSCGVTPLGALYCWGEDHNSGDISLSPTRIRLEPDPD